MHPGVRGVASFNKWPALLLTFGSSQVSIPGYGMRKGLSLEYIRRLGRYPFR